ncbi:hypothetical protein EVAR_100634_1 [Eumeta japonica]|uniref:Uncharacterized protein n=1 Tax=Eumeta variegata TaxID=151549 RepID=A0A4C2A2K8_EUMVA|nr:hypothetical protein EVAR_100634_1 [Eumeta japonica]
MTPWVSISACGTRLLKFGSITPADRTTSHEVLSCPYSTRSVWPRPSSSRANACFRTYGDQGIDWDETIEADAQEVAKMGERHKKLASIRIPRCISPAIPSTCVRRRERKSYAAAVYWRIKLSEHESAVSLIAGRLASLP